MNAMLGTLTSLLHLTGERSGTIRKLHGARLFSGQFARTMNPQQQLQAKWARVKVARISYALRKARRKRATSLGSCPPRAAAKFAP